MRLFTEKNIDVICGIINGWAGKLTWDRLIKEIHRRLKRKVSRQYLSSSSRIKSAYVIKLAAIRKEAGGNEENNDDLKKALEAKERYKAEVQRLRYENNLLLERFVTWANNAHCRGVTQAQLDMPLAPVDRQRTKS